MLSIWVNKKVQFVGFLLLGVHYVTFYRDIQKFLPSPCARFTFITLLGQDCFFIHVLSYDTHLSGLAEQISFDVVYLAAFDTQRVFLIRINHSLSNRRICMSWRNWQHCDITSLVLRYRPKTAKFLSLCKANMFVVISWNS